MELEVPYELNNLANAGVLRFLSPQSAHGDLAAILLGSIKDCGDAQQYCPDWGNFRYVAISTNQIIFAIAFGMRAIGYRLNAHYKELALKYAAEPLRQIDDNWVQFDPFPKDAPQSDFKFWSLKAYALARGNLP
jgi:hypothetical protein